MSNTLRDPMAGCRAYIESCRPFADKPDRKLFPFVTLSRQAGAGAVSIGERIAELLNQKQAGQENPPWTVFDKNLVQRVIEDHQLPATLKQYLPENVPPGITSAVEEMLGLHPSAWTLAEKTAATILRLARLGNVILVGRGANFITQSLRPAVHVRLVAPLGMRVAHAAEFHQLTVDEATRYVAQADQGRQRYVKRFLHARIDDPLSYTLTINTGRMSHPAVAQLIAEAVWGASAE